MNQDFKCILCSWKGHSSVLQPRFYTPDQTIVEWIDEETGEKERDVYEGVPYLVKVWLHCPKCKFTRQDLVDENIEKLHQTRFLRPRAYK